MNALTPFSLAYADVLRQLAGSGPDQPVDLNAIAKACGKVPSNLKRDLTRLREEGLITPEPTVAITEAGRALLAGVDLAEGKLADAPGESLAMLRHGDICRDEQNARTHFDDADLDELGDSIAEHGLISPLVVRPGRRREKKRPGAEAGPLHRLVDGERRWRAIGRLMLRGLWDKERTIPCLIVDIDDKQHAIRALVANLQRVDLSPLEEADGFKRLRDEFGLGTDEIAGGIKRTRRFVQMRLQLLDLSPEDRDRLAAGELKIEDARGLVQLHRAAEAPEHELDVASGAMIAAAPDIELTPAQVLMLVEIGHATAAKPMKSPLGPTTELQTAPDLKKAGDAATLTAEGFILINAGWPRTVTLLKPGAQFLGRYWALASPEERLAQARREASVPPAADGADLYHTAWLNLPKPPAPIELSEAEQLALLEMQHASIDAGNKYRGAIIAPPGAKQRDCVILLQLVERGLVSLDEHFNGVDYQFHIRTPYTTDIALAKWAGSFKDEDVKRRAAVIESLRCRVYPETEIDGRCSIQGYAMAWLNGPFEQTPEAAEARVADDERRTVRIHQETAVKNWREEVAEALAVFETDAPNMATAEELTARLAELLTKANCRAPWSAADDHWIFARSADGKEIGFESSVARRLACIAINVATRVPVAEWPQYQTAVDEDEVDDAGEFEDEGEDGE